MFPVSVPCQVAYEVQVGNTMSSDGGRLRPECQQECDSKHCTHEVSDGLEWGHLCCLLVKNLICLCFAHVLKTEGGCVEKVGAT